MNERDAMMHPDAQIFGEKLWLARFGLVLLILVPVVIVLGVTLAHIPYWGDPWFAAGMILAAIFWAAALTLGFVTRSFFTGKLVFRLAIGMVVIPLLTFMVVVSVGGLISLYTW